MCFRIRDIPPPAFQDLHSLEWIKLYNNDLKTLHYELMEPVLDTLMHIDIHSKLATLLHFCEIRSRRQGSGPEAVADLALICGEALSDLEIFGCSFFAHAISMRGLGIMFIPRAHCLKSASWPQSVLK